jgi:hypothetical protein
MNTQRLDAEIEGRDMLTTVLSPDDVLELPKSFWLLIVG